MPVSAPSKGKENLCPSLTLALSRLSPCGSDHSQTTPEAPKGAQLLPCARRGGNCNLEMKKYCGFLFPVT